MSKIKISTLKNQKAFDLANKLGKKQSGRFFILVSYMPSNNCISDDNLQNKIVSISRSSMTTETKHNINSPSSNQQPSSDDKAVLKKSINSVYLGLKVSKKMGNAVVRNKIRRRIKHMFRDVAKTLPTKLWESRVFVMIPKRGFDQSVYADILKDLIWHVKKIYTT